jgi:hypothetical protein
MSCFKLPMAAASVYYTHKPGGGCHRSLTKWVRTSTAAATSLAKLKPRPKPYVALNSYNNNSERRIPVIYKHGWRIAPCAPLTPSAHDKELPKVLGFRGLHHKHCLASSSGTSSSEEKEGFSGSGSGIVADMGSESKKNHHDLVQSPSSMQNQQNQQKRQQRPSKLLTLPTMLTLARVAAVPLLVSSMCIFFFFLSMKLLGGFVWNWGCFEKWDFVILMIRSEFVRKVWNFGIWCSYV